MARNEGMLMVDALIEAKKRIAELEAELAFYRRLGDLQELKARAEKAEAEVERMRQFHQLYCHPDADCQEGVNPSGDTLGKERDDG